METAMCKVEIPEIGTIYGDQKTLTAMTQCLMHGNVALEILREQKDAERMSAIIQAMVESMEEVSKAKVPKPTGCRKAVGDYKRWMSNPREMFSRHAEIMLDLETGEVWTDCYINPGDYDDYASPAIIYLNQCGEFNTETVKRSAEIALERYANGEDPLEIQKDN